VWGGGSDEEPALSRTVPIFGLTKEIPDLAQRYVMGAGADFPKGFNKPAIFKNSDAAKKWLALKVLPLKEFWKKEIGQVENVATSRTGRFHYFKPNRPLSQVLGREEEDSPKRNMQPEEFLRLWKSDAAEDEFISYTQAVHKIRLGSGRDANDVLWPLFFPFDSYLVNDTRVGDLKAYASAEKATFRLWVGSGGSRTVAHHDWSHNFYVVVTGSKRFVLYPPNVTSDLYVYPYLHSHATKLQPDVLSLSSCRSFPRFPVGKGIEVVLTAGDVLYIPPFWFHDVLSIEPSMTLAVWSPSRDDGLSEAMLQMGLPVTRDAAVRKRLRVVFLWLGVMLDSIFPDAAEFVKRDLLEGRYLKFASRLGVDQAWKEKHCPAPESKIGRYARAKAVIDGKMISKGVHLVESLSQDSRALILGNYVEIVLNEMCENQSKLIYTVLGCFAEFLEG
jgi:hypothetical protein